MNLFKGLSGKFLIPYAFTLIFGIWTYISISNIRQIHSTKDALQLVQKKILEMRKDEKDFLAREHRNTDFLTKEKSEYISSFNRLSSELDSIVGDLFDKGVISKASLDSIDYLLYEYTSTFNHLTGLIKEKGYKDWGLIGELRDKIHAVEDDETEYDRYYMLMLRRHEKDFFLRNEMSYQEKFDQGVEDFKNHLTRVVANAGTRRDLINKIEDYQAIFKRVVKLSQIIGLSETEGAHGKLRAAVHELVPYVDGMVTSISKRSDEKVKENVIILIVLFIVIIAIGIFILVWQISKITRNINLINTSTQMLAEGRFPEEGRVNSRDELGQTHRSINKLIEGLKAKTRFAEKVGKGKLQTELDILSEHDLLGISLLEMRDNLKKVLDDTNAVIRKAGEEGKLESRIDISNRKGAWKELADSINHLLFSVSTPLITLNRIFNEMAKGDLSLRYRSEATGDIGSLTNNLNKALDNLETLLIKVVKAAEELGISSEEMLSSSEEMNVNTGEIASAISEISSGAQAQVQRVDETSAIAERVLSSASDMSEKSSMINHAAKKGVENSRKGSEMVSSVKGAMEAITSYTTKTSESIHILTQRSAEITSVLQVINEISTQTNLLALNAAIEAAQAGEAGRGFAVVAEEIRKLAEETRTSSREIEKLVESVANDTKMAVKSMESMSDMVTSGDKITRETSSVFEEIAVSTSQTLELSEEILSAAEAQKSDIQEIVRNTESIVVIAEQTAAGTEESAASAAELSAGMETYTTKVTSISKMASVLKKELSTFQLREKENEEEVWN